MSKTGMQGFDGAEPAFAVGSVAGARWWDLSTGADGIPWLTGVQGAWGPGENSARCNASRKHPVPDEDCGCGFWAYWTVPAAPNPHGFRVAVLGVIEGYGSTLIGERGFRCATARIVGLHVAGNTARLLAPPPPRHWGAPRASLHTEGARRTFAALTGRQYQPEPRHEPEPESGLDDDQKAFFAAGLGFQLEEHYGVPVYETAGSLLNRHPPTPDYLPPSARPVPLAGPRLSGAEALAQLTAKSRQQDGE